VVVFETGRPIRTEAIFDADRAAPAGRTRRGHADAGREYVETIARHRRAALQVQQRRVPGVTDLAGHQAYAVNLGGCREGRIDNADMRSSEIRPIALTFQSQTN